MNFQSLTFLCFVCVLAMLSCRDNQVDRDKIHPKFRDNPPTIDTTLVGFSESYESTNRGIWQKPELIMNKLGDMEGKTIADIGAGTGYFARRIVSQAGKVIAIDIDPQFITYLDSIKNNVVAPEYRDRLEPRLAALDDPHLKPNEADAVIIVNTFMYIENRVAYLKTLIDGLSDGGKVLIIDFKKKQTPVGPPQSIRIPLYQVEEDLQKAGFDTIITNDSDLDYQYVITATKPLAQ